MKRLSVICMSALLLLAVSCKKDKQELGYGFRATTETQNGSSKTHLGNGSDANHKAVLWDLDDVIKVFNKNNQDEKTFKATEVDGKNALFEGTETIDPSFLVAPYTAFFPSDNVVLDNGNFKLTLSGSQTYNPQNGYGLTSTAYPMMAVSDDKNLNFKNICGLIEFKLTSATACTLQSITLTSNSDEMLYGTGIMNWNGGDPTLGTLSGGSNSITLSCSGTELNGTAKSFYFVVPAGTLSQGFTVKLIDTDNKEWSREASATTVVRNQMVSFNSEVATAAVVPNVSIAHVDGVVLNCSVAFEAGSHSCEYGLVYGTNATPTVSDGKIVVHSSSDPAISQVNFTGNIGIQAVETDYHVRAYCIIGDEVYYSADVETVRGGAIPHRFKIGGNQYVYFSQGNLWANRNDLTNLHFESNQYSYNTSYSAAHVSRFFWSNNAANASNSTISATPSGSHFTLQSSFTANGETGWRIMTAAEWEYLINNHTCAAGKVNGIAGLIVLCDGFSYPEGCNVLNPTCNTDPYSLPVGTDYTFNNYDADSWAKMEANGALFLPAAGRRNGNNGNEGNIGTEGLYASSSLSGNDNLGLSYTFLAGYNTLEVNGAIAYNRGHALRLVRNAN